MHVLILFILAILTFPYWFPVVGAFFVIVGGLWLIGYPIVCTVHWLYIRLRTGKWGHWQLLYPGQ
jgi:hypothetical protein